MDVNGYMLAGIWDPEAGSGDLWEAWPIFFFFGGGSYNSVTKKAFNTPYANHGAGIFT